MELTNKLIIFTIISFIILVLFIVLAIYFNNSSKHKTTISPTIVLTIGVFIAVAIIFYPMYEQQYVDHNNSFYTVYKCISLSIHNSMRLFVLDGEFDALNEFISSNDINPVFADIFSVYSVSLFILAPITVIVVGLSFFKSLTTIVKYTLSNKKYYYYMSELNEHSLILAEDILKTDKKNKQIIFFDVQSYDEESELIFKAKATGALMFSQDINELAIKKPSNKRIVKCYFIAEDEDENLKDSLSFISHYNKKEDYNTSNFQCYVFSRTADSTLLLDNIEKGNIKVRRVNESRNLIINILRNNSIFENYIEKDGVKEINIMIVGLGQYGKELLKAVCWCGQMVGYKLTINVFDKRTNLSSIIESEAPELIKLIGCTAKGEAQYNIIFHDGIDVLSTEFHQEINKVANTTMAFVLLGDDELNIRSAIRLRELFGRLSLDGKCKLPGIYAAVTNYEKTDIINSIGGLKNFKEKPYDINFVGDIRTEYSEEVVEQTELEEKGIKCHLRWSKTVEDEIQNLALYNKFEYYRKSSMSEVLYSELRRSLGIELIHDKELVSDYEHRRWNAYMRTEGYVYNKTRDDIAKTHPSLIVFDDLSQEEKDKDTEVLKASDVD